MEVSKRSELPSDLIRSGTGPQYLSSKQTPSALLLKGSGSRSVKVEIDDLTAMGFPLEQYDWRDSPEERDWQPVTDYVAEWQPQTATEEPGNWDYDSLPSSRSSKSGPGLERPEGLGYLKGLANRYTDYAVTSRKDYRIAYSDPFEVLSANFFLSLAGREEEQSITNWPADVARLQDKIPAKLLGKHWKGSKEGAMFSAIGEHNVRCTLLFEHTHWGVALGRMIKGTHDLSVHLRNENTDEEKAEAAVKGLADYATRLWRRIKCFLAGKGDPIWNSDVAPTVFREPNLIRNRTARSLRFLEMLKTVDGMFIQRFTSLPEEVWTWTKFDCFVLNSISHLIGDEFFDGELLDVDLSEKTAFEQLKDFRKLAKFYLHSGSIKQAGPEWPSTSPEGWFCYIHRIATMCNGWKDGPRKLQCLSYLTQTRCAGIPPPLVVLKSKVKALKVFSSPAPPLKRGMIQVIAAAVDGVIEKIPDHAFTGLHSKAAVNATTAACFEYKRSEYGTLQGLKDIIQGYELGVEVPTMDLETEKEGEWLKPDSCSLGTYIFWACLRICMSTDPDELSSVMVAVAEEPGKARTVTKGRTALKVVLDVVNHICSWPLGKGLESSESGMKASAHAWNVFKSFYKPENKGEFFRYMKDFPKEVAYGGNTYLDYEYKDIFSASTDYATATDYFHHEVAKVLSNKWMFKVGIPPVLRGLVNRVCFYPRKIYFSGSGPVEKIGSPCYEEGRETLRIVRLTRGILMGDPLTKVMLHLLNASVRSLTENCHNAAFFRRYIRNPEVVIGPAISYLLGNG